MKSLLRFAYVLVVIPGSFLGLAACGKVDMPAAQSGGAISSSAEAGSTSSGAGASSTASVSGATTGVGGSAASSTSSSSAASGTGGSSACPAEQDIGKACSTAGQMCFYGKCCPVELQCNGGVWQLLATDCPRPADCPIAPPTNGANCDFCFQASPCFYQCPGTGTSVTATCNVATWSVDATCPPAPQVACGNLMCPVGDVCVASSPGPQTTYTCAPDPCAPNSLSCTCAATLCGAGALHCNSAQNGRVNCDCPTC